MNKLKFMGKNTQLKIFLALAIIVVLIAIFAPFIVPNDPFKQLAPSLQRPSKQYIFGTDQLGRDLFSRVIYGSRYSIFMTLTLMFIIFSVGTILGVLAGYFGGIVDTVIMRLGDMMIAFPTIFSLLILSGCSKNNKVELSLSHVQPESSFSLPPIEQCDSFSIVPPYQNIDSLHNLEIPDDIRYVCEEMQVNDRITTLLFYHKGSVVAYAIMQRSIADFASFNASKKYSIRQQLFLNKERKVIVNH